MCFSSSIELETSKGDWEVLEAEISQSTKDPKGRDLLETGTCQKLLEAENCIVMRNSKIRDQTEGGNSQKMCRTRPIIKSECASSQCCINGHRSVSGTICDVTKEPARPGVHTRTDKPDSPA
ncbi:hypothetical protein J6590_019246 [Homalodisca vitripennis]|nr:hypothetical protein J6590_019246 [Homalodisca vitripennis]